MVLSGFAVIFHLRDALRWNGASSDLQFNIILQCVISLCLCPCSVDLLGKTVIVVWWLSRYILSAAFCQYVVSCYLYVEVVLDEQYHLVFQSLLQPKLVKDLFASSKSDCFFCVVGVLRKLCHYCVELSLWLQFTVYNLGREKNRIMRNFCQTNNKLAFGIGKEMWRLSVGRVITWIFISQNIMRYVKMYWCEKCG